MDKVMKIVSIWGMGAGGRCFFTSRGPVSFSSRTFLCCLVSFVYFDVFGIYRTVTSPVTKVFMLHDKVLGKRDVSWSFPECVGAIGLIVIS